jgi:hypothetical protein
MKVRKGSLNEIKTLFEEIKNEEEATSNNVLLDF